MLLVLEEPMALHDFVNDAYLAQFVHLALRQLLLLISYLKIQVKSAVDDSPPAAGQQAKVVA